MKTILTALPLALILASAASAADMAPMEAPMEAITPISDWTGAYAGVQVGGAFGSTGTFQLSPFVGPLPAAFAPGFEDDFDASVIGGAHLGYDWQINNFVVGGLVDFNFTGIEDKQIGRSVTPATYTIERELDFLATMRLRAGYLVTDDVLVYATGGLAYGEVDFNYSQPGSGATTTTSGDQDSNFGYTVGAGVEAKLTEKISIGAEYLYTDLGGNDFRANLVGGPFGAGTTARGSDDRFDFHTVQVKLTYRF